MKRGGFHEIRPAFSMPHTTGIRTFVQKKPTFVQKRSETLVFFFSVRIFAS